MEETLKVLQPRTVIKCPHCGTEYLPGEVLWPDNVVGYPTQVIRDPLGHIIYEEYKKGKEPLLEVEPFYCENCGKPFTVETTLNCKAKPIDEALDFSTDTTSLI